MLLIVGVMSLGRLADFNTQIDRIVSSGYPLTVKGNQLIGELNGYALRAYPKRNCQLISNGNF